MRLKLRNVGYESLVAKIIDKLDGKEAIEVIKPYVPTTNLLGNEEELMWKTS
eukprot:CAMPEP_0201284850 /NCGR_PEP_ID=MMETSP1317-20130820/86655_1 /ASSEMBLY_ACC=CAM_ASM_000770 /TAXON_ID=187299 /ORGANISM="Undescribed Undescribed, Strain Undescribed" /LENGTH=51 /DNA_ID=CAMNT_0047606683 /DNA_START=434 /DNA_END=589 /DNA_ORIENTATION=+